jgi:hypothetical protein
LIKIREIQYYSNGKHYQERNIEYENFNNYKHDLMNDKLKIFYISIPRRACITVLGESETSIILSFIHPLLRDKIFHIAEIIQ